MINKKVFGETKNKLIKINISLQKLKKGLSE